MDRIVVVGGGAIGLCAAHALRRRGRAVTVVDAGPAPRAASHGNAGWIVPSLSGPVPAPGLARTSLRWMVQPDSPLYVRPRADPGFGRWLVAFWRRCNARDHRAGLEATAALNRRTMALFDALRADGVAFEEHRDGLLVAYRSPAELAHDHAALAPLRPFGYEAPLLDGDAMRELEPALTDAVVGGYRFPQERHVRPDSLVAGLAALLREDDVELRLGTTVTGIEHRRGRVAAVATTSGRVAADAVVVCAGAWTPAVLRVAGVRVPIEAAKGYSLDYAPPPALPHPIRHALYLHEARVAVTPSTDWSASPARWSSPA
jgi:D-amino-acid dehydrogenase